MINCFDQDLSSDEARLCRGMLHNPAFIPFLKYLHNEMDRVHSSIVNAITDNPIKDVLVSQRYIGAEQAIRSILAKIDDEKEALKNMM